MEHESGMQFVASKINKLNIENPFVSLEWEQVKNKTFTLSFENHFLKIESDSSAEGKLGEVIVSLSVTIPHLSKKFLLDVEMSAIFKFNGLSEEDSATLLKYNAAAISYSYLRSIIMSITSQVFVGTPLTLPVINIENFINSQDKKTNNSKDEQ